MGHSKILAEVTILDIFISFHDLSKMRGERYIRNLQTVRSTPWLKKKKKKTPWLKKKKKRQTDKQQYTKHNIEY